MKIQGVLDFGNTRIKLALFSEGELINVEKYNYSSTDLFHKELNIHRNINFILSSVIEETETLKLINGYFNIFPLRSLSIPLKSNYESVNTLGEDRIANAIAMNFFAQGKDALCIDLGTCLKFDFKSNQDTYEGGGISPGINLRFRALHEFTGKLPFLEINKKPKLIGASTEQSIQSGVINGITAEINSIIDTYLEKYPSLTIFMTGGDIDKLDLDLKKTIFADANFTLKGLQLILEHNAL